MEKNSLQIKKELLHQELSKKKLKKLKKKMKILKKKKRQ